MKNIETFNQLANGELILEDLLPSTRAAFPHEKYSSCCDEKPLATSELESEALSKCSEGESSESGSAYNANKVH